MAFWNFLIQHVLFLIHHEHDQTLDQLYPIMASQMHINFLNLGLNFKPGFEKF